MTPARDGWQQKAREHRRRITETASGFMAGLGRRKDPWRKGGNEQRHALMVVSVNAVVLTSGSVPFVV